MQTWFEFDVTAKIGGCVCVNCIEIFKPIIKKNYGQEFLLQAIEYMTFMDFMDIMKVHLVAF